MQTQEVLECLRMLRGMTENEVQPYAALADAAVVWVQRRVTDNAAAEEAPLVMLAAAKVNYDLALTTAETAISSFSAGDLKISYATQGVENAKAFLKDMLENCTDFISAENFAFQSV